MLRGEKMKQRWIMLLSLVVFLSGCQQIERGAMYLALQSGHSEGDQNEEVKTIPSSPLHQPDVTTSENDVTKETEGAEDTEDKASQNRQSKAEAQGFEIKVGDLLQTGDGMIQTLIYEKESGDINADFVVLDEQPEFTEQSFQQALEYVTGHMDSEYGATLVYKQHTLTDRFISLSLDSDLYVGSGHHSVETLTYDRQEKIVMAPSDLLAYLSVSLNDFVTVYREAALKNPTIIEGSGGDMERYLDEIEQELPKEEDTIRHFYLTDDSVIIYNSFYSILAHAYGVIPTEIQYRE